MDRLARVIPLLLAVACAATPHPGRTSAATPARAQLRSPATGLGAKHVLSAGALGYAVAFASDGRLLTIELTTAFDLVVRDATEPEAPVRARVRLGDAAYDVVALAVEPSATAAWVASVDGRVRRIDLDTGASQVTWRLGAPATAVAVSRDGAFVATGDRTGVVCLRRADDGALLQCVAAHEGAVSGLSFGDDALASSAHSGDVTVWNVPSLSIRATRNRRGSANAVAFAPDGARLAIGWSLAPPQRSPAAVERERKSGFGAPAPFATVEIWSGDDAVVCRGHAGPVTSVAWTADGARVLSGSWDRTVRMWEAETGSQIAMTPGFAGIVRGVSVDGDGHRVAIAAWVSALDQPTTALVDLLY